MVSYTSATQIIIQGLGFVCGILIIRLLPTQEYAIYTIANTMCGMMTMLSDGGIQNGIMSQGGKVWKDNDKLGTVIATGMSLRKRFATLSILLVTPILVFLLRQQDVSWITCGLISLSTIPTLAASVSGAALEIAPQLRQDIPQIQKISIHSVCLRLALSGLTLFVFPYAIIALVCSGASQMYGNLLFKRSAHKYITVGQAEDPEVKKEIISIVKRTMPGVIYFAISGQLIIWFLSIFGSTEAIAQAGALSRLAVVLGLFGYIAGTIITPRYARLSRPREELLRYFYKVQALTILIGAGIFTVVCIFPSQVLLILGDQYAHLTYELILMAAITVINFISATCGGLNNSRGVLFPAKVHVAISIAANLLIFTVDYSELKGLLQYSLYVSVINLIYHNICARVKTA